MPEKLKVELATEPADPAAGPGQQLRHVRPTSSTARRAVGPHGRGRHAHHRRCAALPRFRPLQLRLAERAQGVRAALHHAQGAGHRRHGQVAPRMGRRHQGHALAAARPVQARVFEPGGGRATKTDKTVPMRTRNVYLGIRPTFEGRYAARGRRDRVRHRGGRRRRQAGRPAAASNTRSSASTGNYQWYQVDGRWRWQSTPNERLVGRRHVALKADQPTRLQRQLSWGAHRLTVIDRQNRHRPARRVLCRLVRRLRQRRGDARHAARGERQAELHAGRDRARMRIEPPFAGEAHARHRHRPHRQPPTPCRCRPAARPSRCRSRPTGAPAPMRWSRPGGRSTSRPIARRRAPSARAWLGVDPSCARSPSQIGAPEKVTPRQRIEVPIKVGNLAERGGVRHPRRGRRGHPAAHALQDAQSRRLLLRQAPARRRHARRLRPPARRPRRRSRPHPDRRRCRRHRRPRHRADAHRRAVQRTGEARRQGRGQDRARHPRLHRPAQADGGGLRQDARRLGRPAPVRARRGRAPTWCCRASWRPTTAAAWRCRCTMSTARPATIA